MDLPVVLLLQLSLPLLTPQTPLLQQCHRQSLHWMRLVLPFQRTLLLLLLQPQCLQRPL
jgi:hypothetical protein